MTTKKISATTNEQNTFDKMNDGYAAAAADLTVKLEVLSDLKDRLANGDMTVTGADRASAEADVVNAEAFLVGAEARREAARSALADAIASNVADDLARESAPHAVASTVSDSNGSFADAVGSIVRALRERDEASDRAGRRLADAGVPEGQQVGRVRYLGVSANGMGGRRSKSEFNVAIDGEWLSNRQGIGHTRDEGLRIITQMIESGLREHGLKLTDTGVASMH